MTKMILGIIEYIDSAHYLPGHKTCGIVHGHTYKIEVMIEGEKKENGMVMDFYEIKKILKDVLKEYDHKLINDIISYPSVENICEHICSKLTLSLDFTLMVRVWEGEGKWCEINSENLK